MPFPPRHCPPPIALALWLAWISGCRTTPPPITSTHACPSAPVATPVATTPVPPRTNDPLFLRVLLAMDELPAKEGWILRNYQMVQGQTAAIAVLDQPQPLADCNRGQPLLLVGKTKVLSTGLTSGYSLLSAPNGALLWDLRGDGPRFLVAEEHLCNFATSTTIHGLDDQGEWSLVEGDARPSCVTCTRPKEATIDGKPLFSKFIASLTVASGGPYFPTSADIHLIEAWDGSRFRSNLPALAPLYQRRLAAAREAGKRAQRQPRSSCNTAVFGAAGEIYVYSRMLGQDAQKALAEADRLVKGIGTKPCETNHEGSMYGTQSYDWTSMRDQLLMETETMAVIPKADGSDARP